MAIWQDLVDDHGFAARYASVPRFVRMLRGAAPIDARVVITTALGEESQVDYGERPMVRHPATGKYRSTRLFVLTLGYSRKSVRLLVWMSSAQIWAELHQRGFRRLGARHASSCSTEPLRRQGEILRMSENVETEDGLDQGPDRSFWATPTRKSAIGLKRPRRAHLKRRSRLRGRR